MSIGNAVPATESPNVIRLETIFQPERGSTVADYCTAMVGIARSSGRPATGKFNQVELLADQDTRVEELISYYWRTVLGI